MSSNHILVWNARGLNSRARRSVVREFVVSQRISVLCLQESKVQNLSVTMANDITGPDFDYVCLLSVGAPGGLAP